MILKLFLLGARQKAEGAAVAAAAPAEHTSSCRVKFGRKEFLRLVEIAKPRILLD